MQALFSFLYNDGSFRALPCFLPAGCFFDRGLALATKLATMASTIIFPERNHMNTGHLLDQLRAAMDTIDELNQSLSALKKERAAIESQLKDAAEAAGVDSFSNSRISVSLKEDFIAAYEPDQWNDLVKWAADTGNFQLIQRRISTKPVKELIDNGCEIPAGVRLEPTTRINVRRK